MSLFDQEKPLSPELQAWIAENLLLGISADVLVQHLGEQGIPATTAQREITLAARHPYLQAARQVAWQANKHQSLLMIRESLEALSPEADTVPRVRNLSREAFRDEYYVPNRPVIVEGAIDHWPALRWTPESLKANYGEVIVEVQADRDANPRYQRAFAQHTQPMRFGEYIDRITQQAGNDIYLAAKNNALQGGLKPLLRDIDPPAAYFAPDPEGAHQFLWFGPGGTITALHHDWVNAMIAQVYGQKRVRLVSPSQSYRLYNHESRFSDVDLDQPDLQKHPLFEDARVLDCVLAPGDVIFIPVGWWHDVRSLDVSLSVTMTNFVFPNEYSWLVSDTEYAQ